MMRSGTWCGSGWSGWSGSSTSRGRCAWGPPWTRSRRRWPHGWAGLRPGSFRISAQRSDKGFPLDSPQINRELGAFVQGLTGLPVKLKQADLNIRIHIFAGEALVSVESLQGPGGLPVGVGGRVAQLMSGGIDSPVAAQMMMKRGCRVLFIHFHSFPLVEGTSREKAEDLVRLLTSYQLSSRLLLAPFAEAQKQIILWVPPAYRVVVYRRFMMRIAEALAVRHGAGALVTGESLGQVSSQTLENLSTIEGAPGAAADLPAADRDGQGGGGAAGQGAGDVPHLHHAGPGLLLPVRAKASGDSEPAGGGRRDGGAAGRRRHRGRGAGGGAGGAIPLARGRAVCRAGASATGPLAWRLCGGRAPCAAAHSV